MLKPSTYIDALINTAKSWNVKTVKFNPDITNESELEKIEMPAIFIFCDQSGAVEYSERGNGALTDENIIEFVCLYAGHDEISQKKCFNLQSFVKRQIFKERWGLGEAVNAPQGLSSVNASGRLKGFSEWRITFYQSIELEPPTEDVGDIEVYLGINPPNFELEHFEHLGKLENE